MLWHATWLISPISPISHPTAPNYIKILFAIPLTAVAAEKLKELWNLFDKNKDGVGGALPSHLFLFAQLTVFASECNVCQGSVKQSLTCMLQVSCMINWFIC